MRADAVAPYIPGVLEAIGYDPDLAQWAAAADSRLGRVVTAERGLATLLTASGEVRATYGGRLLGWIAGDSAAAPCVGDWAVLRDWPDRRVTVERIVPRRTSVRGCVGGHVLAANVDLVAVVVAADVFQDTLPRLGPIVAMAEHSGARPLLVLTRCDRVEEQPAPEGCDVVATSARTGRGLQELRGLVDRHLTMAMLGAPGQGRSTLLRSLVGDLAVRRAPKRMLYVLPSGGAVIDTPSLRALA